MSKRKKPSVPDTLGEIAQQRYAAQSRQPHATVRRTPNPHCARCGWRIYPLWGPHACGAPTDEARINQHVLRLMADLHFYRFVPKDQVGILAIALGRVIAANQRDGRGLFAGLVPLIDEVIRTHIPLKAKKQKRKRR